MDLLILCCPFSVQLSQEDLHGHHGGAAVLQLPLLTLQHLGQVPVKATWGAGRLKKQREKRDKHMLHVYGSIEKAVNGGLK